MTPGRQDLAAVIAELQRELDGTRPPIQHRERIHSVPRSLLKRVLALLLAEAQLPQVQEHTEVTRVDAMGDSKDNPTAAINETKDATVTPNQKHNELPPFPGIDFMDGDENRE
jgi:hypothetical protein